MLVRMWGRFSMEFACMLSGYQEEVGQMLEAARLYITLGLVLGSWLILSLIFHGTYNWAIANG